MRLGRRITATAALCAAVATTLAAATGAPAARHQKADVDWTAVGQAIGIAGTMQSGGVYRVDLPRADLKVSIKPTVLKPSFALGGYLVFLPTGSGNDAMLMG